MTPDAKRAVVFDDRMLQVLDLETRETLLSVNAVREPGGRIRFAQLTRDGTHVIECRDTQLQAWRLADRTKLWSQPVGDRTCTGRRDPIAVIGRRVFAVDFTEGRPARLRGWNLETGTSVFHGGAWLDIVSASGNCALIRTSESAFEASCERTAGAGSSL